MRFGVRVKTLGHVEGFYDSPDGADSNQVSLVVHKGAVQGSVVTPKGSFQITSNELGQPVISQVDPQTSQPPVPTPCTDGLFRRVAVQDLERSPDAATVRERAVTFEVGQVQAMPARLRLNLFDDVCVVALRQPNAEAGPVPVWNGSVEGVPGSQVTIIFNPGAVAGSIVVPPQAFNLELVRDGIYRVREVDVTRYANELPPLTPASPTGPPGGGSPMPPSPGATPSTPPSLPPGPPPTAAPPTVGPPKTAPPTKPPPPKKRRP